MLADLQGSDLLTLGSRIVGLTFLWSGGIKASAPHIFERHLNSLGWIPRRLVPPAVIASAAGETGLGSALAVGAMPGFVLPTTIVLLFAFSFISWWGVRSGKATDCGCYGGFIQPSIEESLGINALLAALIALAWSVQVTDFSLPLWKALTVLSVTLAVALFTHVAQAHARNTAQPLIDLNPLKAGNRWRHSWAHDATKAIDGEIMVAFLGPDCPFCSNFVRVGNAMMQSSELPRVVGVVGTSRQRLLTFVNEKGIRFPTVNVSQSLMSRLVSAVPTVALVEAGRIKRVWVGDVPPDIVDRFKAAFFPIADRSQAVPNAKA